ncbi:SprT-like family-domain-containing protein [Chaetomidium leptoderma]|uniref:SprT-like family-domain-containing protein n=1 Tax=Chaetomidium leptoderma TaxID=669021 RepID=A0AAN6ZRG7_9PEZI|nr:SprT-like family-domain-containing protein [Chaetomidium leptoderma]
MARLAKLAKPPTAWSDDDGEFPDIDALVNSKKPPTEKDASKARQNAKGRPKTEEPANPPATVRRRKLGPLTDNLLLRAWAPDSAGGDWDEKHSLQEKSAKPRRTRVELRTRNTKPAVVIPSSPADQDEEYVSAQEEVTIIEEVSMFDDDTFHSCGSEDSEFSGREDAEEDDEEFSADYPPMRPPAKPRSQAKDRKRTGRTSEDAPGRNNFKVGGEEEDNSPSTLNRESSACQDPASKPARQQKREGKAKKADKDLADTLSKLRLDETEENLPRPKTSNSSDRDITPPSTPPKSRPGLVSPKKLTRIPTTPHRPNSDMFWSQEFVDDWNEEHSPRKQLFPDAVAARQKSPTKNSPEKKPQKNTGAKKPSERETKKAFEKAKHDLAEKFLQELDTVITNGKLAELAASTGGVKLIWTNKLNTTAGRANWKRETIRTRRPDGTTGVVSETTRHKHHASIELAEKVIDDEHRLLNVLAHEFCHLANFMVSGVTTNPHGREFKAWAAQCSRAFGDRGIDVTTKHSYDIDFKYVWECVECAMAFKRHSRSIDPARHRCGSCKSELRQTKPVPRKKKEGGAASEYQAFMKAQMRVVKEENPRSPQKEIMKIVAGRWAAQRSSKVSTPEVSVQEVANDLEDLAV